MHFSPLNKQKLTQITKKAFLPVIRCQLERKSLILLNHLIQRHHHRQQIGQRDEHWQKVNIQIGDHSRLLLHVASIVYGSQLLNDIVHHGIHTLAIVPQIHQQRYASTELQLSLTLLHRLTDKLTEYAQRGIDLVLCLHFVCR